MNLCFHCHSLTVIIHADSKFTDYEILTLEAKALPMFRSNCQIKFVVHVDPVLKRNSHVLVFSNNLLLPSLLFTFYYACSIYLFSTQWISSITIPSTQRISKYQNLNIFSDLSAFELYVTYWETRHIDCNS